MLFHHWYSNYCCSRPQRTIIYTCCRYWKFSTIATVEISGGRLIIKTGASIEKVIAAAESVAEIIRGVCDNIFSVRKYIVMNLTTLRITYPLSYYPMTAQSLSLSLCVSVSLSLSLSLSLSHTFSFLLSLSFSHYILFLSLSNSPSLSLSIPFSHTPFFSVSLILDYFILEFFIIWVILISLFIIGYADIIERKLIKRTISFTFFFIGYADIIERKLIKRTISFYNISISNDK